MLHRTDDDIYRARFIWLGPAGRTLPFRITYAQYLLFAIVCPLFLAIAVALVNWWASGVAVAAAVFVTHYVWRFVDPDQPARKVLWVAVTDWRRLRASQATPSRLSARHIRVRGLTKPGAERSRPTRQGTR